MGGGTSNAPAALLAIGALSVAGLTSTTPLLRRATFATLATLSLQLVFAGPTDYLVAIFTMINLFRMFDLLILTTDVQKDLRRKGETLDVTKAPFLVRLKWALGLYASLRGVGWSHEPTSHLSPAPDNDTRTQFIFRQMLLIARACFILNVGTLLTLLNPSMKHDSPPMSSQPLWIRFMVLQSTYYSFYGTFSGLYGACGIVGVVMGVSMPKDWPPLFGPVSKAYTMRNFWGRVWHQVPRKFITAYGTIIANALRIPKGRFRRYFSLYIAFLVSGVMHQLADISAFQRQGTEALVHFFLQACAITLEDAVQELVRRWGVGVPPALAKLVGYVWVQAWLSLTAPLAMEPHIRAGLATRDGEAANAFVRELARKIEPWISPIYSNGL